MRVPLDQTTLPGTRHAVFGTFVTIFLLSEITSNFFLAMIPNLFPSLKNQENFVSQVVREIFPYREYYEVSKDQRFSLSVAGLLMIMRLDGTLAFPGRSIYEKTTCFVAFFRSWTSSNIGGHVEHGETIMNTLQRGLFCSDLE